MSARILTGRLLNALRSVAVNPKGLRIGAFPKAMAQLVEMASWRNGLCLRGLGGGDGFSRIAVAGRSESMGG